MIWHLQIQIALHNECLERLSAPLDHDPTLRSVLYKGGKQNKSSQVSTSRGSGNTLRGNIV